MSISRFVTNVTNISSLLEAGSPKAQFGKTFFLRHPVLFARNCLRGIHKRNVQYPSFIIPHISWFDLTFYIYLIWTRQLAQNYEQTLLLLSFNNQYSRLELVSPEPRTQSFFTFRKLIDETFFLIFFPHFKQNYFLILFVFLCVGRPQCREDKCHLWDQNAPDVTPPKVNKPHNLDKQSCDIEKIAEILRGWDN